MMLEVVVYDNKTFIRLTTNLMVLVESLWVRIPPIKERAFKLVVNAAKSVM